MTDRFLTPDAELIADACALFALAGQVFPAGTELESCHASAMPTRAESAPARTIAGQKPVPGRRGRKLPRDPRRVARKGRPGAAPCGRKAAARPRRKR